MIEKSDADREEDAFQEQLRRAKKGR